MEKFLNWSEISRHITGSRTAIRSSGKMSADNRKKLAEFMDSELPEAIKEIKSNLKKITIMEKEKLGQEPAFPPTKEMQELAPTCEGYHVGMSKRFYAACCAMRGMLANPNEDMVFSDNKKFVKECYAWADELLKQENE